MKTQTFFPGRRKCIPPRTAVPQAPCFADLFSMRELPFFGSSLFLFALASCALSALRRSGRQGAFRGAAFLFYDAAILVAGTKKLAQFRILRKECLLQQANEAAGIFRRGAYLSAAIFFSSSA